MAGLFAPPFPMLTPRVQAMRDRLPKAAACLPCGRWWRAACWRGAFLGCAALLSLQAQAQGTADPAWVPQVQRFALEAARHQAPGRRIEVEVGKLDPRLRLAPCRRAQPYLAGSQRLWGRSRVGLRCAEAVPAGGGAAAGAWSVSVPVTVKVFGLAYVAAAPLAAGSVIAAADMAQAEVDLAESPSSALTDAARATGRTLARGVASGKVLRESDLRPRVWFAAGDEVRLVSRGAGFQASATGQALSPGIEGQPVRARTESGRIVKGLAVAHKEIDLTQ